jgi:hypothetical protein
MSAKPHIQEGFFIIADISGYTSFLSGTGLEHAQAIIEELTKLVLDHIRSPMKMVKLEGDAVFYYVPGEMLPEAERLLDHIESCYFDFVNHIQNIQRLTTCRCRACSSMHTLDLKFFAHYGEYINQKLPGTAEDVVGPDVILLHRLLKNSVTEKTGLRGYALLTNACLERIGKPSSIRPHTETYEHLGEVQCSVHDLRAVAQMMREARRIYIEPDEADFVYERIMHATPELLWSFNIDPQRRMQWQNITGVKNTRNVFGRSGVGGETHCSHGSFDRISRILDWRPFHYYTLESYHKPAWKGPPALVIFEFIPVDAERTRISFRLRSLRRDWLTLQIFRLFVKSFLHKEFTTEYDRLEKELGSKVESSGEPQVPIS